MTDDPMEPADVSIAGPGDMAFKPGDGDVIAVKMTDSAGNTSGYLIRWKNTPAAWFWAGPDDYTDLTP